MSVYLQPALYVAGSYRMGYDNIQGRVLNKVEIDAGFSSIGYYSSLWLY